MFLPRGARQIRLALSYPNGETAYRELTKALGNKIALKGRWPWLVKKP